MNKKLLFLLLFLSGCIFVDTSPERCYHLWDPSQKDNCLMMVASETMNISKCGEIEKASVAEQCYSLLLSKGVAPNASICQKLSGVLKEECFSRLAVSSNDSSYCMRMETSYYRDNCLSKLAVSLLRPDLCEGISANASRSACKNQIYSELAIKNREPQYCEMLISDYPEAQRDMVDACLFSMAKELNDKSYCSKIQNPFSKELCTTGRIDPSTCDKIAEPQGKQACLYVSAVYSKDPNACTNLPSESLRDNCYLQVAKDTGNPKICSYITTAVLREQCQQLVKG
ncbi:MAG: hypothetical protein QXF56_01535 [Candidatus Micrarchaeia archaeon]